MWLGLAISAYFCFGLVNFLDKYLIGGPLQDYKIYSFYMGMMSIFVLFLIPIGFLVSIGILSPLKVIIPDFSKVFLIPSFPQIVLSLAAGATFLFALATLYRGIQYFEVSRITPAVGGLAPLFTLGLTYLFTSLPIKSEFLQSETLGLKGYLALAFLTLGSVIITLRKKRLSSLGSLKISALSGFLFALGFILIKLVYSYQPFWSGFIWIKIGSFLAAFLFLATPKVREEIIHKRRLFQARVAGVFLTAKVSGAAGTLLRNGAIFLAPMAFLPLIHALAGIQYVFLIVLATLLFFKYPRILQEEVSPSILTQKIIAILFIGVGLYFLAF